MGFYYLQKLRNTYVFYNLHFPNLLCFIPLTLFKQLMFKMVLFEMIQIYPNGHATYTNRQYDVYMAFLKVNEFTKRLVFARSIYVCIEFCKFRGL